MIKISDLKEGDSPPDTELELVKGGVPILLPVIKRTGTKGAHRAGHEDEIEIHGLDFNG